MAENSKIEWTDATWNPTVGCSIVSPGCANCYAMILAAGLERRFGSKKYGGLTKVVNGNIVWTGEVRLDEDALGQPLKWKKPRRIFVNSMSDLFHEALSFGQIMRVFHVMWQCRQHTFQVLTKRPDRMREFMKMWGDLEGEDFDPKLARGPEATRKAHPSGRGQLFADMLEAMGKPPPGCAFPTFDWMGGMINWPDCPPNVWLGVSAERQQEAIERVPILLDTPAAKRFVSLEPLLGPVTLWADDEGCLRGPGVVESGGVTVGTADNPPEGYDDSYPGLDWVIVGGESGRDARTMDASWASSLRDQCAAGEVAFFMKQMTGKKPIPADLLVRQFPDH